jgi:hypothetical protein
MIQTRSSVLQFIGSSVPRAWALWVACGILCATFGMAEQNDWLLVPGKRLGPIRSDATRADLDRLFGKTNVQDRPVDTGEGEEDATVVFPNVPTAALAIFWQDDRMVRVMVCYQREASPCKWHTENGVSLGTSLQQLEKLNGRAFQIEPWGYHLDGNISSWLGGKLASIFGWQLRLGLYFREGPTSDSPQQVKLLDEINRQKRSPLSSDLAVRQLRPTVVRMRMDFTNLDKQDNGSSVR